MSSDLLPQDRYLQTKVTPTCASGQKHEVPKQWGDGYGNCSGQGAVSDSSMCVWECWWPSAHPHCLVGCCCPEPPCQEEGLSYFVIWLVEAHMRTATLCQPEVLLTPWYLWMVVHGVVEADPCHSLGLHSHPLTAWHPSVVVAQALHLLSQWITASGPRCSTDSPDACSALTVGAKARLTFRCWACHNFLPLGAWAGCSQMWSRMGSLHSADSERELQTLSDNQAAPSPRSRNILFSKENGISGICVDLGVGFHRSHPSTSLPPLSAPWHRGFGCYSVEEQQSIQVWTMSEVQNRSNIYFLGAVDLHFHS